MAGTRRHATPDAGEDNFKTSTRQMSREMHIPDAWHQANEQDSWGTLRLRRRECGHRKIKGAVNNVVALTTETLQVWLVDKV
jgi:hypothetical protein